MRTEDLPPSTPLGTAPAELEALIIFLRNAFPGELPQQFQYAGCVKNRRACCRMFTAEPFANNAKLFRPIPSLEAMARELVRITNELSSGRPNRIVEWKFARPQNINGAGIIAYPIRAQG